MVALLAAAAVVAVVVAAVSWGPVGYGEVGQGRGLGAESGTGEATAPVGPEPDLDQSDGSKATGAGDAAGLLADGLAGRLSREGVSVQVVPGEVEQAATRLLSSYREAGDCVLASFGYLDLVGSVWSCTVQGDGWVDVCVIGRLDDETCELSVLHMDRDEMAELFSDEGNPAGVAQGDDAAGDEATGEGG